MSKFERIFCQGRLPWTAEKPDLDGLSDGNPGDSRTVSLEI